MRIEIGGLCAFAAPASFLARQRSSISTAESGFNPDFTSESSQVRNGSQNHKSSLDCDLESLVGENGRMEAGTDQLFHPFEHRVVVGGVMVEQHELLNSTFAGNFGSTFDRAVPPAFTRALS